MPEIKIRPKRKEYPIVESVPSGALSTSGFIRTAIDNFDYMKRDLESIISQDRSMREWVFPTIQKVEETRKYFIDWHTMILSAKRPELSEYERAIQEYEGIISKEPITEWELQEFFEEHPFLVNQKIKRLISKKSFGGEGYPDFVAVLHNRNHILIEIEKSTDKLYTKAGNPTAKFSHAEQQIRDYLKWAQEEREWLRKRGLPNISPENTKGLVIIGLSKSLTPKEKEKLENHNFGLTNHEIQTFDDILRENQQVLKNLRKLAEK